jgi:hypothetical protein
MLEGMKEPDEAWAKILDEAAARAKANERGDVSEYLSLKAANDKIRTAGIKWLLDSSAAIAAQFNREENASITIEEENPHDFAFGNANLVGSLLRLRQGVRCLTFEAGWTRTPNDGFMRGGALACARISHFGIAKANEELILVRADNLTNWFSVGKENNKNLFNANDIHHHFDVFLNKKI